MIPSMIRRSLASLDMRYPDGSKAWQHFIQIDPLERLANIRKSIAYLARYGRIDPYTWDDKPISEMWAFKASISEIVSEENALNSTNENT